MRKKGRKVEDYHLRSFGTTIEIRMTSDLIFFAQVGNDALQADNAETLRCMIREKIEELHDAEWKPIIEIEYKERIDHPQEAHFELSYEKFYCAEVGDKVRQISWANYEHCINEGKDPKTILYRSKEQHRKLEDKLKTRSCTYHRTRNGEEVVENLSSKYGTFYKPYSEELWNGLEKLREAITLAKHKISQLLSTEEGIAKLKSEGKLMITFDDKNDDFLNKN